MIYIKIYLNKDENGEDMLVFDSAKEDDESHFFTVAGEKMISLGLDDCDTDFEQNTKVVGVEQVAISREARAFFLEILNAESVCSYEQFFPDFEFHGCSFGQYGWSSGMFAFYPPNIRNGDTSRTLRRGESFKINYGDAESALEYMTSCDNEMLKNLDLTKPVDETVLLDTYYAAMRARGEELGCDVGTIRRTPLRYLTEAQKAVIREEYKEYCSRYSRQEWNDRSDYDHSEFLEDKIKCELIKKYGKYICD